MSPRQSSAELYRARPLALGGLRALRSPRVASQRCYGHGQAAHCTQKFVFSLRSLVDTHPVESFVAWKVASELWPEIVVGPGALYIRYLSQVWEAASTPVDAVLLARVLAEEGVIGAAPAFDRSHSATARCTALHPQHPSATVCRWSQRFWPAARCSSGQAAARYAPSHRR